MVLNKIILNKIHTSQVPKKSDYALRSKVFCLSSLFIVCFSLFVGKTITKRKPKQGAIPTLNMPQKLHSTTMTPIIPSRTINLDQ